VNNKNAQWLESRCVYNFFFLSFFFFINIDTNILKKGNKLQSSAKKRVVITDNMLMKNSRYCIR